MGGIQRVGQRFQDAPNLGQGHPLALRGDFCHSLGQRAAIEVFHDHVGQAACDIEPVHLHDMRMAQASAEPGQLAEALPERGIV